MKVQQAQFDWALSLSLKDNVTNGLFASVWLIFPKQLIQFSAAFLELMINKQHIQQHKEWWTTKKPGNQQVGAVISQEAVNFVIIFQMNQTHRIRRHASLHTYTHSGFHGSGWPHPWVWNTNKWKCFHIPTKRITRKHACELMLVRAVGLLGAPPPPPHTPLLRETQFQQGY